MPVPWVPGFNHWDDDDWDDDLIVYNNLPGACEVVSVDGASYSHCGNAWYKRVFQGNQISYVEVPDPR